jgi:hypothetical protein
LALIELVFGILGWMRKPGLLLPVQVITPRLTAPEAVSLSGC